MTVSTDDRIIYEFWDGPQRYSRLVIDTRPGGPFVIDSQAVGIAPRDIVLAKNGVVAIGTGNSVIGGNLIFTPDQTWNIGAPGARVNNMFIGGNIAGVNLVSGFEYDYVVLKSTNPGGGVISNGSGAPAGASGANGDFYFRTDTPGTALQRIYIKSAGAWVGIV